MSEFDARAKQWEDNPVHGQRTLAIAQAMRERIPLAPTMRALEVGCGTGLLSFELRHELGPILLTDTSEGMLEVVSEKIAALGAEQMTPMKLDLSVESLPPSSRDLVYSQMALHHMGDIPATLRDFYEVLASGGYLAIADLDREDGSFHGPDFTGHHGFDRSELVDLARAAGFEEVVMGQVFEIKREVDGASRCYPIFLLTARKI